MFIRAIRKYENEAKNIFKSSKRVEAIRNKQSSKTLEDSFTRLEYAFVHKDIEKIIDILENELFLENISSYKIYNKKTKQTEAVFINRIIDIVNSEKYIELLKEMYIKNGHEGFFCCFGSL